MNNYINADFLKCAIITIDMQNDFALPGAIAEIKGTREIIPQITDILTVCRVQKIPILHVIRLYKENGSNVDLCRRELIESGSIMVRPGTSGADLVEPIKPHKCRDLDYEGLLSGTIQLVAENEWVLYKSRWGTFYQTKMEEFLKNKGITTLIFMGCNFPNCPRTSMYEASERDFKVVMVKNAISGVYERGVKEINGIGARIYSTNQLIQGLKRERKSSNNM